jgi:hypothetical protein
MIGVIADPSEHATVREFFELFKTPWEFCHELGHYDVVLRSGDGKAGEGATSLLLLYAGRELESDSEHDFQVASQRCGGSVLWKEGIRVPLYGESVTFSQCDGRTLAYEDSGEAAMCSYESGGRQSVRIGYDLFREIRILLEDGQPAANACFPALELHIALLRDLIVGNGIPLIEIPPVPDGHRFIACLTHDIDHPSIRGHKFDHTIVGFLYRATIGSLVNVLRGRAPLHNLWSNWTAVLRLPFVYLGLAKDFWAEFDRYPGYEGKACSSFFVIPFKNDPGWTRQGRAPRRRAARYGAADIVGQIRRLLSADCEIGLHGIDAWLDAAKGTKELEEIRRVTGAENVGVRMHWLYLDQQSVAALEEAGVSYDSTIGYNDAIGYRAGTTQVYKPLNATRLLELPLHVMDTALFFPAYLDLSPNEATKQVSGLIDDAVCLGGCLTINWHDRSIAPERLWGDFYKALIADLKKRGAWFATASKAVMWFQKRRSAAFEGVCWASGSARIRIPVDAAGDLPDMQLRVHTRQGTQDMRLVGVPSDLNAGLARAADTCVTVSLQPQFDATGRVVTQ